MWTIDPQGWRGRPSSYITGNVFSNVRNGSIVLMHLANLGDYEALEPIIQGLRAAGYRLVTVAELFGDAPFDTPAPAPPPAPTAAAAPSPTATPAPTPAPTPPPSAAPTVQPTAAPATPAATPTPTSTPAPTPTASPGA
jgi:hypothetical protein